ncbi:tetratricopeptide repeat protein [Aliidiomarina halalkaliphila]|uniref:Tetratricopeptide repeat protein n=1 Tax=Aliidiomarina halalkaliphila TaxID=2593535 RepID=A0A552X5N1_9GAMM|nr:PA2778 family cysteine peptidase [Aliidiomarina halalkaliphila]TRW49893.1 tetratricopeptide repeat protein [Aliidiomarina halalkaliphila]
MTARFFPMLIALLGLSILTGCASAPMQHRTLNTAEFTPVELVNTPFFPQDAYQCGPAALATVLVVSGVDDMTPDVLKPQVYLPEREGSLQPELLGAARRADRIPYPIQPQLAALFTELEAGHPVLVLQNLGVQRWPRWHYAVVIGFDPQREEVILRSGTTEREVMSLRRFEQTWQLGAYWGVVVTEPGQIPATAEPVRYLAAVSALEQQQRFDTAIKGYEAALRRWPREYTPAFGLGNIAYQQGRYADAEMHYYHATELAAEEPVIYFNLAWALLRQGKRDEAMLAAEIAQMLAPDHDRYGNAVAVIESAD